MSGKRMFHTFKEAAARGAHDEYPMLPPDVDMQLTLSRSDCAQPFFVVLQKDSVLVQMSGEGRVEMKASSVSRFAVRPGDFVYVPGGVPHRLISASPSVHYRYRAANAGLEAVVWFCEGCGAELARYTWNAATEPPHRHYAAACAAFNGADTARHCDKCGTDHPALDLRPFRWNEIVAELAAEAEA